MEQTLQKQCKKKLSLENVTKVKVLLSMMKLESSISFLTFLAVINAPACVLLKYWVLVGKKGSRKVQKKSSNERRNVP